MLYFWPEPCAQLIKLIGECSHHTKNASLNASSFILSQIFHWTGSVKQMVWSGVKGTLPLRCSSMEILKELQIPEMFYWCSIGVDIYSAIATLFLYCSKCCVGCMNIDRVCVQKLKDRKKESHSLFVTCFFQCKKCGGLIDLHMVMVQYFILFTKNIICHILYWHSSIRKSSIYLSKTLLISLSKF